MLPEEARVLAGVIGRFVPMRPISDFIRNKAVANILCRLVDADIDMIVIVFEGGRRLTYDVDIDTDELRRRRSPANLSGLVELGTLIPQLPAFQGKYILWAWEMVNQQGYFDALQIQFASTCTVQFLVCGSSIHVRQVNDMAMA